MRYKHARYNKVAVQSAEYRLAQANKRIAELEAKVKDLEARILRDVPKWCGTCESVMDWKEIDTAPKDGTPVIVGIAGLKNSVGEAYWWHGGDGSGGWQTWDGANHTRTVYTTPPTHWMPFPDEPNSPCLNKDGGQ